MSTTFFTVAFSVYEALRKAPLIGWDIIEEPDQKGVVRATVEGHKYEITVRRLD